MSNPETPGPGISHPDGDAGWTMILEPPYLFVRRDFVASYKQTILGPLWFLIQPLLTALIVSYFAAGLIATPASPVLFRG